MGSPHAARLGSVAPPHQRARSPASEALVVLARRHAGVPLLHPDHDRAAAHLLLPPRFRRCVREHAAHHLRGAVRMVHPHGPHVVREPDGRDGHPAPAPDVLHPRLPPPPPAELVLRSRAAPPDPVDGFHRLLPGLRAALVLGRDRRHEPHRVGTARRPAAGRVHPGRSRGRLGHDDPALPSPHRHSPRRDDRPPGPPPHVRPPPRRDRVRVRGSGPGGEEGTADLRTAPARPLPRDRGPVGAGRRRRGALALRPRRLRLSPRKLAHPLPADGRGARRLGRRGLPAEPGRSPGSSSWSTS